MLKAIERIPAHVRYPGLVLTFLLGSVLSQVFLFRAAFSGQGLQVEKDYYQRALDWDKDQANKQQLKAMGLELKISFEQAQPAAETLKPVVAVNLNDAKALKSVTIEGYRPHLTKAQFSKELDINHLKDRAALDVEMAPGQLWDFNVIVTTAAGDAYVLKQRREARL